MSPAVAMLPLSAADRGRDRRRRAVARAVSKMLDRTAQRVRRIACAISATRRLS